MKKLIKIVPTVLFLLFVSCATTPFSCSTSDFRVVDLKCEKHIQRTYIETCFSYRHMVGKWSFYKLKFSKLTHNLKRKGHFKKDPLLDKNPDQEDYKYTGYDKGHLANSNDFSFDQQAMQDSFYLSNIGPQDRFQNQRGAWKKLEDKIRKDSTEYNREYYILAGTVLTDDLPKISPASNISVPKYFFKIIMWHNSNGTFEEKAYKIPNYETKESDPSFHEVAAELLEKELEISIKH